MRTDIKVSKCELCGNDVDWTQEREEAWDEIAQERAMENGPYYSLDYVNNTSEECAEEWLQENHKFCSERCEETDKAILKADLQGEK